MKKFLLLGMVLTSFLYVAGCGHNPGEADPAGAPTQEQQTEMNDIGKLPTGK